MTHTLRLLTLGTLLASAGHLFAQQPYTVVVSGHVNPCTPAIANGVVTIQTIQGTQPQITMAVPLNANCYYYAELMLNDPNGWIQVSASCANGAMGTNTGAYAVNMFTDSTTITLDITCGGAPNDCLGVPGGTALPGTACTTFFGLPGTWNANCQCQPIAPNCQACFVVGQASDGDGNLVPYEAVFNSCSVEDGGSYNYNWVFPDGSLAVGENATWTVPGEGVHVVCLWMEGTDNNCVNTFCDSIYVDANGTIQSGPPSNYDCLGILNGPNLPGAPCSEPGTGLLGTWSATCECLPNVSLPCEAGFWVMQAYDLVTIGNDTSMAVPIPFELWIWNLSSGGTGNYQFVWDFGDGNSSTEPYPTHVYAAAGPYNLCLTMTDDAGCTSTFCEEIEVDQDGLLGMSPGAEVRSALTINVLQVLPTGVAEQSTLTGINLWPNPVQDQFNLTINSSRSGTLEFVVLDLNGRLLLTSSAALANGKNQVQVDVNGLESGMYLLRMAHGQQSRTLRFVKH